jgi:hypothetical protein
MNTDSSEEGTGPWAPSGVIFFRDIALPPTCSVPRMRHGRSVSNRAIEFFFNKDYKIIQRLLDPVGILSKDDIPETRIPTVKSMTKRWVGGDDEPDRFDLGGRGYALHPSQFDEDDDMDLEEKEGLNDDPDATIDKKLTAIWYQFLIDIIQKSPNPKDQINESYCRTLMKDRLKVRDDFYQNRTLSDIWRSCQYKMATPEVWENTFARFWPSKDHALSRSAQNYLTCRYYLEWKRLISYAPSSVATAARDAIREKFDVLYWIPAAKCDKMWDTKKAERGFTTLPSGHNNAAPQLLIRGGQKPVWARTL